MTRPRCSARRRPTGRCLALLALGALLGVAAETAAHPLAPMLLEISEQPHEQIRVRWKEPLLRAAGSELAPALPPSCETVQPPRASRDRSAMVYEWTMRCASGALAGQTVGVTGLADTRANVLLQIELRDGRRIQELLTGSRPQIAVPARVGRLDVARRYLELGARHLLTGWDHQLFLLGLMLLVSGLRSLVATITCFTLGHALTLCLASLGWIALEPAWIEVAIALSLVVLAAELARRSDPATRASWLRRRPATMALLFGLLHGLGFASALAEIGLPGADIPLALLAFNLGIELGQLLFIGAAGALWLGLAAAMAGAPSWRRWLDSPVLGRTMAAYGIGTLAAYWCIRQAWDLI